MTTYYEIHKDDLTITRMHTYFVVDEKTGELLTTLRAKSATDATHLVRYQYPDVEDFLLLPC